MADETPEVEGEIAVPLVWVGADELPVYFVNQFVGVIQPNEIFLTFGSVVPPAIMGDTIEERMAQAQNVQFVPVRPIVRLGLTPERLKELIKVLETTLANYGKAQEGRS